jgi:hypothetical protein
MGANFSPMTQAAIPTEDLAIGPITGATLALLELTKNEWLKPDPLGHRQTCYMASLAWLYVHSNPIKEVESAARTEREFLVSVLEFGARVSVEQLLAADAAIQGTLAALAKEGGGE